MKVKLKSKLGRPFWRFGVKLSPDSWTEFDLTEDQLDSIKEQCLRPVAEGGTLEIMFLEAEPAPPVQSPSYVQPQRPTPEEEPARRAASPIVTQPREPQRPAMPTAKEPPKGR